MENGAVNLAFGPAQRCSRRVSAAVLKVCTREEQPDAVVCNQGTRQLCFDGTEHLFALGLRVSNAGTSGQEPGSIGCTPVVTSGKPTPGGLTPPRTCSDLHRDRMVAQAGGALLEQGRKHSSSLAWHLTGKGDLSKGPSDSGLLACRCRQPLDDPSRSRRLSGLQPRLRERFCDGPGRRDLSARSAQGLQGTLCVAQLPPNLAEGKPGGDVRWWPAGVTSRPRPGRTSPTGAGPEPEPTREAPTRDTPGQHAPDRLPRPRAAQPSRGQRPRRAGPRRFHAPRLPPAAPVLPPARCLRRLVRPRHGHGVLQRWVQAKTPGAALPPPHEAGLP